MNLNLLAQRAAEFQPLSHIFFDAIVAFVLAMLLTPVYTRVAFNRRWWRKPREQAVTGEKAPVFYRLHAEKHKRNIPTMAGLIILASVVLTTGVLNLNRNQTWLLVFSLVMFGALGIIDDVFNIFVFSDKSGGLKARTQLLSLIVLSLLGAWWFYFKLSYNLIHVPGVGDFSIGWLYIPLFVLVTTSSAKAVSITDGLDGLAGGLLATAFGAYSVIAYFQGNYGIAAFCATVVGAVLAYTWFNIFPARFFMGQTGSTALGATLGVVAMLTNSVFVLPIIAGVFVVETASSLLQILSKKIFHRKIFLSAPLHHHLEAIGWPETKVTMRLWVIGQVLAAIGLVLGLIGNKVIR